MAIGERIHFFRTLRGMTQKYLGMAVGFPERSADVRLAQYETGTRTPKADLTAALAHTLDVSPQALSVPDIDNYIGLAHTLFALEDVYSLKVVEADGRCSLRSVGYEINILLKEGISRFLCPAWEKLDETIILLLFSFSTHLYAIMSLLFPCKIPAWLAPV